MGTTSNHYGRALGKELAKKLNLEKGTKWTPKMMASFLNEVGNYVIDSFYELNGNTSNFLETDKYVIDFTKTVNDARD